MNAIAMTKWQVLIYAAILEQHDCQFELAEDRTGFYVCCVRNVAIRLEEWFEVVDISSPELADEYFVLPIAV